METVANALGGLTQLAQILGEEHARGILDACLKGNREYLIPDDVAKSFLEEDLERLNFTLGYTPTVDTTPIYW